MNRKLQPTTSVPLSFSFSDNSFLLPYQLGVVKFIQERIDTGLLRNARCLGTGAGGLAAVTMRFGIDAERVLEEFVKETKALADSWGPLGRVSIVVERVLNKLVPIDKERLEEGKLQVSLTRLRDLGNVRKKDFSSKKEVVETVLASMGNPFTSRSLNGTRYMSGDYSKSDKVIDKYTFTVSGKANSANISPSDGFTSKEEVEAQSDDQIYRDMAERGYNDAAGWFEKRWDSYVLAFYTKRKYPKPAEETPEPEVEPETVKRFHPIFAFKGKTLDILTDGRQQPQQFVPLFY